MKPYRPKPKPKAGCPAWIIEGIRKIREQATSQKPPQEGLTK